MKIVWLIAGFVFFLFGQFANAYGIPTGTYQGQGLYDSVNNVNGNFNGSFKIKPKEGQVERAFEVNLQITSQDLPALSAILILKTNTNRSMLIFENEVEVGTTTCFEGQPDGSLTSHTQCYFDFTHQGRRISLSLLFTEVTRSQLYLGGTLSSSGSSPSISIHSSMPRLN